MCGLTVEKRNIDHNFIRLFLMFRKHTKIETVWKLFLKSLINLHVIIIITRTVIKISLCTVQVFILHQLDISNGGWRYQGCCSSLLFYVVSVFLGIKLSVNKYASNYLTKIQIIWVFFVLLQPFFRVFNTCNPDIIFYKEHAYASYITVI